MTTKEYLEEVLKGQDMAEGSDELEELREHREKVEKLLRDGLPDASPTIRYGGSRAKGTLIRESYDLDLVFYIPHDNDAAGKTLKDIYDKVKDLCGKSYYVEPKTSALRLKSKEPADFGRDFHIDVVPGRFVDASKGDCYLHQEGVDKERLKTNLGLHVDHVKDSGVVPAIRLLKLWKVRRSIRVKQFAFELLIIDLLKKSKGASLADQLILVWKTLKETETAIGVEDPANPSGNDLSPLLKAAWWDLRQTAATTLDQLERYGWEAIFGLVDDDGRGEKKKKLERAAASPVRVSKPWRAG